MYECVRGRPSTHRVSKSCKEVDDDRNNPKDDFYRNEHDDDLLEAFGVSTRHGLLQELEHVLQHLDAGVEQVDALWDLEITTRCVVKRSQVGI